jgi:hypothetical protein
MGRFSCPSSLLILLFLFRGGGHGS